MAIEKCLVSGTLYDVHGNPLRGAILRIRHIYMPIASGTDSLVLQESQRVISNADGEVEFTLIQGAKVRIELPNRSSDFVRTVTVPEEDEADIVSILFPHLVSVEFDEDDPVEVSVGDRFSIGATGTLSDGTTVDVTPGCTFESSDEDVVKVVSTGRFRAVGVGTTTISITEVDTDDLEVFQEPDGDVISRLDMPEPTLPSPITVEVS